MSGTHSHAAAGAVALNLFGFRVVPVEFIARVAPLIRQTMFGGAGSLEVNPQSGYIRYRNAAQLYRAQERKQLALPRDRESATAVALRFVEAQYAASTRDRALQTSLAAMLPRGERPGYPFSVVPPPTWLEHVGTFLVKHDRYHRDDHWLCKFQVAIETPAGTRLPVMGSGIDLRIGEATAASGGTPIFPVIGFHSRWRPVYAAYPVRQLLPDTGQPREGPHPPDDGTGSAHVHFGEFTKLTYVLSDENVPQLNLLPYEATVAGGHHMAILPASTESLWVELRVTKAAGRYRIEALAMGGSGNYRAQWGYWNPFQHEPDPAAVADGSASTHPSEAGTGELNVRQRRESAQLQRVDAGSDLQLYHANLELPEDIWEVVLHVYDDTLHNFISRRIMLGIAAVETMPPQPVDTPPQPVDTPPQPVDTPLQQPVLL